MSPHSRSLADAPAGKRPPRIRIYLKHFNDPEERFTPQHTTCKADPEKHRVGCGGGIVFYRTYPNEKRMPFDGAPVVVTQFPVDDRGAVIALVETTNVHFATCPARAAERRAERPTTGFADARTRAAGGDR